MNLEESTSFMQEEEKKAKKKKIVVISIVLCALLIVALFCCILAIQYKDAQTLKMFIDGTQVSISSSIFKQIDDKTYVNIREMGEAFGYHYNQGEYNNFNENEDSCYLTNEYEIIAYTAEQDTFTKYAEALTTEEATIAEIPVTVKSTPGQAQKYSLESNIKLVDGIIYAPFEAVPDMFNVQLNLSQENRIKMYTLEQIVASAQKTVGKLGYTSMSGDYENLKAMIYGFAVVGNGTNFGVISLTDGKEIIGLKYEDITFIPNLKDFQIKAGNTVGIFASDGSTVIKPTAYDEISVYDDDNQLYLVKKDGKFGILNRLGKVIIYPDYDEIGYTFNAGENKTKEYKLLFNKCIPVKESSKYGLFSIEGEEILPCVYDELGSALSFANDVSVSNNYDPVLDIPEELGIYGLVINQNGSYGVFDINTESIIIPVVCSRVYSVTKAAKTTYYVQYNGQDLELDNYLTVNNLKSLEVKKEEEPEASQAGDTTNEVAENTSTEPTEEQPAETTNPEGQGEAAPTEQQ